MFFSGDEDTAVTARGGKWPPPAVSFAPAVARLFLLSSIHRYIYSLICALLVVIVGCYCMLRYTLAIIAFPTTNKQAVTTALFACSSHDWHLLHAFSLSSSQVELVESSQCQVLPVTECREKLP